MNKKEIEAKSKKVLGRYRFVFFGWWFGCPDCCVEAFIDDCTAMHYGINPRTFAQRKVSDMLGNVGYVPCHSCAIKVIEGKSSILDLTLEVEKRRRDPSPVFHDEGRRDAHYLRIVRRLIRTNSLPEQLHARL